MSNICNQIPKDFTCNIETIIPESALHLLGEENYNTYLTEKYTDELISKLMNERDYFDGSPIILSDTGKILSGFELLTAIAKTKVMCKAVVSRGIPERYYKTIDIFSPRRTTDDISILQSFSDEGRQENANDILSAIKLLSCINNGIFKQNIKISSKDILNYYQDNKKLIDDVFSHIKGIKSYSTRNNCGRFVNASTLLAFLLIITNPGRDDVDTTWLYEEASRFVSYICQLNEDNKLEGDDNQPIEEYIRYMKKIKKEGYFKNGRKKNPDVAEHIYWLIKTWNAWVSYAKLALSPPRLTKGKSNCEIKIVDNNFTFIKSIDSIPFLPLREVDYNAQPEVSIELITPDIAREMLNLNNYNRNLKGRTVDRYARDMLNGKWLFNGETIKIAHDNEILDAQHRLNACIESDCSFYTVVVKNVNPASFVMYDRKRANNFTNIIEKEYGKIPHISETLKLYARLIHNDKEYRAPMDEMYDLFVQNSGIINAINRYKSIDKNFPINKTILIATHYLLSQIDSSKAENLFNQLTINIPGGDYEKFQRIIYKAKNKISSIKDSNKKNQVFVNLIIHFWNAWIREEEINENSYKLTEIPNGSQYEEIDD